MLKDTIYSPTSSLIEDAIQNSLTLNVTYMSDEGKYETYRRINPMTLGRKDGELYVRV
jgi:predicted DNA-binding transcriptional regulator YafY